MNGERLAAFERLLALPDPKVSRWQMLLNRAQRVRPSRYGHRLTYEGDRFRISKLWQRCADVWMAERIARAEGWADGWKPAQPTEVHAVQFWPPQLDAVLFRNVTH